MSLSTDRNDVLAQSIICHSNQNQNAGEEVKEGIGRYDLTGITELNLHSGIEY